MFWLILLLILLYFIAAPIIRVWRKVRSFQDEYNKAMNEQGNYQTSSKNEAKTNEQREMVERYHRYSDETAENVDFEELDGPMTEEPQLAEDTPPSSSRYQEEPITDAEFEEI